MLFIVGPTAFLHYHLVHLLVNVCTCFTFPSLRKSFVQFDHLVLFIDRGDAKVVPLLVRGALYLYLLGILLDLLLRFTFFITSNLGLRLNDLSQVKHWHFGKSTRFNNLLILDLELLIDGCVDFIHNTRLVFLIFPIKALFYASLKVRICFLHAAH